MPDKIVDRKILVLETYSDPADEASETNGAWARNHLELSIAPRNRSFEGAFP